MRNVLEDEVLSSRDVMFLPEYEIASLSDTTTAYEFRKSDRNYPVEDIWEAAKLSGRRGGDIAAEQVRMLKDDNKIIRYWAALGLRSQDEPTLGEHRSELLQAMDDPYPPVAVTAAAIVYQVFREGAAGERLKSWCLNDNTYLSLMAINYLIYISDKAPFIETVRSVHDREGQIYDVKAACMDFLGSLELVPNNFEYRE